MAGAAKLRRRDMRIGFGKPACTGNVTFGSTRKRVSWLIVRIRCNRPRSRALVAVIALRGRRCVGRRLHLRVLREVRAAVASRTLSV